MKNLRAHHLLSFLAAGGVALAALNFSGSNTQPLFNSSDSFVLFASEEVKIALAMNPGNSLLQAFARKLGLKP